MNKEQVTKYFMMGLGVVLTVGANIVSAKNQDNNMKEAIAKEVAEALKNQAKES